MGFISTIKEKFDMYDTIISSFLAGSTVITSDVKLDSSMLHIGFNHLESESQVSKYYVIRKYPMYIQYNIFDRMRNWCIREQGIKMNIFMYSEPHKIQWDSARMKNKLNVWKNVIDKQQGKQESTFDYRMNRARNIAMDKIRLSNLYLMKSELDYQRSISKTMIVIEFSCKKDDESLEALSRSINLFKSFCSEAELKTTEIRVNVFDWMQSIGVFSLKVIREVAVKMSYRILTDDVAANFNSYKQGVVGQYGACLGVDIHTGKMVLHKFKDDPDAPENWLIIAETGGGKSLWVKSILPYVIADEYVVTILDFEGDEYRNFAAYMAASNPDSVRVVSMEDKYFDPMEIGDLTGDEEVDKSLKINAMRYTENMFKIIIKGIEGEFDTWESGIMSDVMKTVYEEHGIRDDDRATWIKSRGLRLKHVFAEMLSAAERGIYRDTSNLDIKHKALMEMIESCKPYFVKGGSKSYTFKKHMSINDLFKAKLIVFSFGVKGEISSQTDTKILALKQLSVINISIQISNYCKYVRKVRNVKVWEEYQRWGMIKGSSEIIVNAMTGGRKRGDVNLLITNNPSELLDESNNTAMAIANNIQNYAIGGINVKSVRVKFCEAYGKQDMIGELNKIAKANRKRTMRMSVGNEAKKRVKNDTSSRYQYAFCVMLDDGKMAVVKSMLPKGLRNSKIYSLQSDDGGEAV